MQTEDEMQTAYRGEIEVLRRKWLNTCAKKRIQ